MNHLTNTYLPTISLLIIVESTLFLDCSRQDFAVSLYLANMLVVYTFYQSISHIVPKTTYLEFVDYWLIFCLKEPFVVFLKETKWYLKEPRKVTARPEATVTKAWGSKKEQKPAKGGFLTRQLIRILAPIVTVALSCFYMALAAIIYA